MRGVTPEMLNRHVSVIMGVSAASAAVETRERPVNERIAWNNWLTSLVSDAHDTLPGTPEREKIVQQITFVTNIHQHWRESIKAFGPGPLSVLFLDVPGCDVVEASITENVFRCLSSLDIPCFLADHQRQFSFIIDALGQIGRRQDDHAVRIIDAG